jgi:hypothetical protein
MPQLRINAIDRSSRCVSHAERHGHLDATAGRKVVYCHACVAEWYRDENGLTCPECHGEITEIVGFPLLPLDILNVNRDIHIDPANDPRDFDHHSSASASPEHHPYDSDPEEADIDEHTQQGRESIHPRQYPTLWMELTAYSAKCLWIDVHEAICGLMSIILNPWKTPVTLTRIS